MVIFLKEVADEASGAIIPASGDRVSALWACQEVFVVLVTDELWHLVVLHTVKVCGVILVVVCGWVGH